MLYRREIHRVETYPVGKKKKKKGWRGILRRGGGRRRGGGTACTRCVSSASHAYSRSWRPMRIGRRRNELVRNMLMRPRLSKFIGRFRSPLSNGNPYLTPRRLTAAKITNLAPGHPACLWAMGRHRIDPRCGGNVTIAATTTFKRSSRFVFQREPFDFWCVLDDGRLSFDCFQFPKNVCPERCVLEYSMQCAEDVPFTFLYISYVYFTSTNFGFSCGTKMWEEIRNFIIKMHAMGLKLLFLLFSVGCWDTRSKETKEELN